MFIPVPIAPPAPPSPEAQELGRHLTDVINAYQPDHPNMSSMEVRQAIQLARRTGGGTDAKMAITAIAVGLVAMMALGVFFFRSNPDMGQVPWLMVAIGVMVVALGVVAAIKSRR
jgi:hypothetical protein